MAKKNNDLESLGTALLLMALFITGVFFLFKWAIAGIVAILSVIVVWAINLKNKKEKERIFKKWQDSLFGDSYIRPTKKVNIEELKEKLDLLDTTIYDDQFDSEIIERGKDYVCRRKITRAHRKGHEWTAIVKGRNSYNVKVELEDSKIKNAECDCLYFQDKQQYCKHIYATLYFTRSVQNCQKISDSIGTFLHQLSKLIVMENNYIKTHKDTLHPDDVDESLNNIESFNDTVLTVEKNLQYNYQNEDIMFSSLVNLMQDSYKIIDDVETMIIEADKLDYPFTKKKTSSHRSSTSNSSAAGLAGLFALNELSKKQKSQEKDEKLEKEMDIYGLEDWQKEEVRKGNYDPWSFEEEDLEDDDYYHDDSD